MTTDAIALLPARSDHGQTGPGGWTTGPGPTGAIAAWRPLADGTLVNLALPYATGDADLHEAARRWMDPIPDRIWVFPDGAVPDLPTSAAMIEATREVGRWAQVGKRPAASPLVEFGFGAEEVRAWQADMASGDHQRMTAAMKAFEQRVRDRDPADLARIIARALGR